MALSDTAQRKRASRQKLKEKGIIEVSVHLPRGLIRRLDDSTSEGLSRSHAIEEILSSALQEDKTSRH